MSKQPNILMIYCDELRADALSCYPNATIKPHTPNVDRLAARGVVFENCFCSSPICVSSRVSMLTSTHCETHGVYANEGVWPGFNPLPDMITWPEVAAAAGYATGTFGKHHVPDTVLKWDNVDTEGGGMGVFKEWLTNDHPSVIRGAGINGGRLPADIEYPPEQVTEHGIAWMEAQDKPFICRLSYLQPHTPVFPPAWAVTMYEEDETIDGRLGEVGDVSQYEKQFAEIVNAGRLSSEQVRLTRVYYYALVTWVDQQLGRVMDWLEERGELEHTIIVIEADHGAALGEGGRYAKHVFSPEVHRTPRLIACPDRLPRGERRGDICDSLDIGPTLLSLAGVPLDERAADQFEGRDLFKDPEPQAVFATIGQGQSDGRAFPNGQKGAWSDTEGWPRRCCVRTPQYRLDRNERMNGTIPDKSDRDVFLCDWRNDPLENRNLVGDARFAGVGKELSDMLDKNTANSAESTAPAYPWRR